MGTLSKLRRLVRRDGLSVREAARRLGIARNTAAKWLATAEMVEPRYPKRADMPSILDPYKEQLTIWLKADSTGHPSSLPPRLSLSPIGVNASERAPLMVSFFVIAWRLI